MADDSGLDPVPVGSVYGVGGLSSNDPLVDWGSNLNHDDLANLLNDPYRHAQALAARGIEPPSPEAMQTMHDANDAAGTPSRSTRFQTSPAEQFDQTSQGTGKADRSPLAAAPGVASPFPGGTTTEGAQSKPPVQTDQIYIPGKGWVDRPGAPKPAPTPAPAPAPAPAPTPPAQERPKDRPVVPVYTPPPRARVARPGELPVQTQPTAGEDLKGPESPKKVQMQAEEKDTATRIGELGKALQGVKAPEPLRPPGFAPAPHGPTASGAPNIAALLGALSRTQTGQVPPSAMPLLRLLGRA